MLIFTNLDDMIQCLVIGNKEEVAYYTRIISRSKYFGMVRHLIAVAVNEVQERKEFDENFDAVFIVSRFLEPLKLFSHFIKKGFNIYFIDQPELRKVETDTLEQLVNEGGGIIFPEVSELANPLLEEFISFQGKQFQLTYTKSVTGKKDYRQTLLTGISFISLLTSMAVKKINVNTIETSPNGRPLTKVKLKMYDSSVCDFFIIHDNNNSQTLKITSKSGSFFFNISENYVENINGSRFLISDISTEDLLFKTIETFALDIILNRKPTYSFMHYRTSVEILQRIEAILLANY
jgi:hypothetical protein